MEDMYMRFNSIKIIKISVMPSNINNHYQQLLFSSEYSFDPGEQTYATMGDPELADRALDEHSEFGLLKGSLPLD